MSKQEFKKTIEALVAKFERNVDRYKDQSSSFNETQLRIEFIDPMYEALGWDMNNKAGAAEQYKEVIHEDKVYIEGKPKAPDYSFKFWGERKFFLEAKQPFVKIKTDYKPALQLRRYAWSAHLPISILSDFEELAIYDTTIEPKANDKASTARLTYYKYTDYLDKWEEIYDLFAKESIQQGSFDKFIAKEKRGSQLVDKVFLKEIENWREWLAKDIAKHNSELTVEKLNFAVQKIIDRIIFLRIAEDRGIEVYKTLEKIIKSQNSYKELVRHFKLAHDKYNSGLFDFVEDTITPELNVSDKLLDKILEHLYYPNSPYEFSVLGVELLGSIYEQFLGKVIRLTAGHNAKVEEKPEVKKAGGVFYTPQYIVEYIVKNTVGELLKDKSIKQAEKIKVLDPACGSGSFLIGAYEFLLNWHLAEYEKLSDIEKEKLEKKGVIYKITNKGLQPLVVHGEPLVESWQLTTNEKKRIMLNNIYGVDIDKQAVEVTKLSLALKMLENENQQSINNQMKLFAERILPDMSGNIKCGNSLVGSDYWTNDSKGLKPLVDATEEEIKKVNAFDWDIEFKEIMDKGGFDAVIGNPPYLSMEDMPTYQRRYLYSGKYFSAVRKSNLYSIFTEKAITCLRDQHLLGFIIPYSWISNSSFKEFRDILLLKNKLEELNLFPVGIFEDAGIATSTIIIRKGQVKIYKIQVSDFRADSLLEIPSRLYSRKRKRIPIEDIKRSQDHVLNPNYSYEKQQILEKLNSNLRINDFFNVDRGCDTANNKKYTGGKFEPNRNTKRLLEGKDFGRYFYEWGGKYIYYEPIKMKKDKNTARPGDVERFESEKKIILYRFLDKHGGLVSTIDADQHFCLGSTYVINKKTNNSETINIETLQGILSSRAVTFVINELFSGVKVTLGEIKKLPLPRIETVHSKTFIKLINKQIEHHKLIRLTDSESKKQLIQKQIDATDEKINKLVYKLYNLTDEEIEIIEDSHGG